MNVPTPTLTPVVNSGGIATASMRDTDQSFYKLQEYIAPESKTFSAGQKGGAPIKCKGKKRTDCSKRTCLWTSRGYCRKRGKMTCRGKVAEECTNVKINIPGLVPPVVGRCKYIRGNVRNSCRRIRHFKKTAKKSRGKKTGFKLF
jgi:hypothetical protein